MSIPTLLMMAFDPMTTVMLSFAASALAVTVPVLASLA